MKKHLIVVTIILLSLTGCEEGRPEAVIPSPLFSEDSDRLYLAFAAFDYLPIEYACYDYYQADPDDPRYPGHPHKCVVWELNLRDHLRASGYPDTEVSHLRDPAIRDWWSAWKDKIGDCREKTHWSKTRECHPYDKYERNPKLLKEMGIKTAK